jgi:hypothetical protein
VHHRLVVLVLAAAQASLESKDAAERRGAAVHEAWPVACEQKGKLHRRRERSSARQDHALGAARLQLARRGGGLLLREAP